MLEQSYKNQIDVLTGLGNKDKLIIDMEKLYDKGAIFSLALVRLNRLNNVNIAFGHPEGDKIIKNTVRRIHKILSNQTLMYRFTGPVFAIIGLDGQKRLEKDGKRIIDAIRDPFDIDGMDVFISSNVGIVHRTEKMYTTEHLLRGGETSLYDARNIGVNTLTVFNETKNTDFFSELKLENGIRQALINNDFELFYQPLIQVNDGKIVGAEALIRWFDKEEGMIPPNEFIPVAERSGLINLIGDWVLQEACRQVKEWQDKGLPSITINVNIGSLHFQQSNFYKKLVGYVETANIPPSSIGIEITEGTVIADTEETVTKIKELKNYGVRISIDDFGTGYSSLSYLKKFPIDTLKIDQSFVREIPKDPDDIAIVRAIIDIAKNMELKLVAEGVETLEAVKFLKALQCFDMQGYLFSKPLPKKEFEKILSESEMSFKK